MNIEHLHLQNLKLFKDFELSFTREDGGLREWTVLIGENGTGKTTLLQAIAMAAAGGLQVNRLAGHLTTHLCDRRSDEEMRIEAQFRFSVVPPKSVRPYPAHTDSAGSAFLKLLPPPSGVVSHVCLARDETSLRSSSRYSDRTSATNPLDTVRSKNVPLWFVAGYGVSRQLPDASKRPSLSQPSIERMLPLFRNELALTSTGFINYFKIEAEDEEGAEPDESPDKAQMFNRMLKRALLSIDSLLPMIKDVELRGYGGVRRAGDLQERDRFRQRITESPDDDIKLPLNALSHGYQSTIAWIADLIGHIVLEAETELKLEDIRGLVLIDELDLLLHPTWQIVLVRALRKTFPGMQFVASTHSPLVLAGLDPDRDQIVRLELDRTSGDIRQVQVDADPRLLTGTELLQAYFSVDDIHPDEVGRILREYRYIAANPFRSDEDDANLARWSVFLHENGVDPHFVPVERENKE